MEYKALYKGKEKITHCNSPVDYQDEKIYIQSTFNYYPPYYSKLNILIMNDV